jgi:membrane protein implicated in regulation of membrane protease activity
MAVVMGIGEMLTAGFFQLPFAIGAAVAAILAWLDVDGVYQWIAFFLVSGVAFAYLRRFVRGQDEGEQPPIGANRWVNRTGMVLETIDVDAATGIVRIDGGEEWRATSDGGPITAGTRVIVNEVRGARLVVTPEQSSN